MDAAATGARRRTLEALRDLIARTLVLAEPREIASLAKQLRETVAELDALPDGKEKSASDDLTAKRAARRSAAKTATRTG